jgi:RNA 2',3'-cyclic 3'-phosphodiesterase
MPVIRGPVTLPVRRSTLWHAAAWSARRVGWWETAAVRLFIAVMPPDDVLDVVAGLRRRARDGVRWTTRAQWHVTLRFLGDVADPAPVAAALDGADLAGATAVVGPRVAALGRGVVVVPVAGLDELAAGVTAATGAFGRPAPPRRFRGHLTLARTRGGSVRGLVGEPVGARFPVDAVRLVRSHLGPDGARYEDLHVRLLIPDA